MKSADSNGWLVFDIFMLALFGQGTYEFAEAPHNVYHNIAAAMNVIGFIFFGIKVWRQIRASPRSQ